MRQFADFPRPTDITGVRSWYGLIEQIAYSFAKFTLMDPFRPLLKKKSEFSWSQELQQAFDTAKKEIVSLIQKGVKSFTLGSWTCLITDWSRTGLGFVLWQKLLHRLFGHYYLRVTLQHCGRVKIPPY